MTQVQQHVRFNCVCGKQIEGPSKSFISCPHCFITVGVPDPSRIPKPDPPPAPPASPKAATPFEPDLMTPKSPNLSGPYDPLFTVADYMQLAVIPLSGVCVVLAVIAGATGNFAASGFFVSAAISGAFWWVALEVAKVFAQMANGMDVIVKRHTEADKDKK